MCQREKTVVCSETGFSLTCAECESTAHTAMRDAPKCPVCLTAATVPGKDPTCHQCCQQVCIHCSARIFSETNDQQCPLCRASCDCPAVVQVEGLLTPREDGTIPGLHAALGMILLDWWKRKIPSLAKQVVKCYSWQSIALEEPFEVAVARLCRGTEYAGPFALGLAILAWFDMDPCKARELRVDAIKYDRQPYPAHEFMFKHDSRISPSTKALYAKRTLQTCQEAGEYLATLERESFSAALLYSISARLGSLESATKCVSTLVSAQDFMPKHVSLRQSIHDAAFKYGSGYAAVWLADDAERKSERIRFLERAMECGVKEIAYTLGVLLEETSQTSAAISAYTVALIDRDAYYIADVHFRLARIVPSNLGMAEIHLQEAVKRGHQQAGLALGNISVRGTRHNLDETKRAFEAYTTAETLGSDAALSATAKNLKARLPLYSF